MNNFDRILSVWDNLDEVYTKKFSQLTNTEFFKKLLGFVGEHSGVANIQSKIMQDIDNDPAVLKKYNKFMKVLQTLSSMLESGTSFEESLSPSEIFASVECMVTGKSEEPKRIVTAESITGGILDIMDTGYNVTPEELLATGNVFSYTAVENGQVLLYNTVPDPDGYVTFTDADNCNTWVMSHIASQETFNMCTSFEKSVIINTLYAISKKSIQFPVVFLNADYAKLLLSDRFTQEETQEYKNVLINLDSVKIAKDSVYTKTYVYKDTFLMDNHVVVVYI